MSKTVLITGGNRGLGLELVKCFAGMGWNVLATARNVDTLPKDLCVCYPLDLQQSVQIDNLVHLLSDKKIDLLIHNAGFNPKEVKEGGYFESTFYMKNFSAQNVAESCMINALHPMELTGKLLANHLTENVIVIGISSWLGSIGKKDFAGHYGYAGSKALLNMCLKGLSLEFEKDPDASRCAIALNPGWMSTDMGGPSAEQTPEQVAKAIYDMVAEEGYLLSQNGKFINADRTEHEW